MGLLQLISVSVNLLKWGALHRLLVLEGDPGAAADRLLHRSVAVDPITRLPLFGSSLNKWATSINIQISSHPTEISANTIPDLPVLPPCISTARAVFTDGSYIPPSSTVVQFLPHTLTPQGIGCGCSLAVAGKQDSLLDPY